MAAAASNPDSDSTHDNRVSAAMVKTACGLPLMINAAKPFMMRVLVTG